MIRLARPQDGTWELRLVRRIGKYLSLQAKAGPALVGDPIFSFCGTIQKVSRIELEARLICQHGHYTASQGIVQFRRPGNLASATPKDPIVVIPFSKCQLLIGNIDSCTNGCGRTEVKWRVLDACNQARRDKPAVNGRRIDLQDFRKD
jgi:hypothetical protein